MSAVPGAIEIIGLIALVAVAFRVGSGKRKDATIADLEISLRAKLERITDLESQVQGASERADSAATQATEADKNFRELRGRYDELRRYTAQEAVTHFERMMQDHSIQVAERHALMLEHLGKIDHTLSEALSNQGELILKNTELLARITERLEERPGAQ